MVGAPPGGRRHDTALPGPAGIAVAALVGAAAVGRSDASPGTVDRRAGRIVGAETVAPEAIPDVMAATNG